MLAHQYATHPADLLMVPLGIAPAASDDAEAPLAQLGAAFDASPAAIELGIRLRNLLSQAAETADQLASATGPQG